MNTMRDIFMLLMLLPAFVSGTIIEVAHFAELENYVGSNTLLLLDVDDTLMLPMQTLGNDAWFQYRWDEYISQGYTRGDALERALADWEGVRHLTGVCAVEEYTSSIVADLQKKGVCLMGLTTQGMALATRTVQQLASLGMDLSLTAPRQEDYYFLNGRGVLFHRGLLFTAGSAKGKAVLSFLAACDYQPQQVVFINDKRSHLEDVENALSDRGIPFVGLRYSYGDARVAAFDPHVADVQWNCSSFAHILSDEEAKARTMDAFR
jgi:hypothetical protein